MIYRRFGKTELAMPVISAGFMRCMHKWDDLPMAEIPGACQDNMAAVITKALAAGINHIETARGYGSSERQLGRILPDLPRNEIIVQTKVQPCADPEEFLRQFKDSRSRLNLEYIDLLAIHGINDHRSLWQTCRKNGCLAAARRLQNQGIIGHVGFSGHGPTEVILEAVRHEEDSGFDYLNLHWYYIYQTHWPAISEARDRDMGVFVISPSDKGGRLYEPPEKLTKISEPLTPMLFNDLFCLSHPEVSTISVGASRPEDFEEHLKALPLLDKAHKIIAPIDKKWRLAMYEATGYERPDSQTVGLPPWDRTPGNINLPMILWLYNLYRGWDLKKYAGKRYQMIGNEGPWVPGRKAENAAQFDFSGILRDTDLDHEGTVALLAEAHKILSIP